MDWVVAVNQHTFDGYAYGGDGRVASLLSLLAIGGAAFLLIRVSDWLSLFGRRWAPPSTIPHCTPALHA